MSKYHYYLELLIVLISKELKIRYKSTVFGYLWSVASPLAFALTFYVVFSHAMRIDMESYLVFLLSGMFPWQYFNNSVNQSPGVFLGNANLIKKVTFPRIMLALAMIGNNAIHFLFALPVLFAFLWGNDVDFHWSNIPWILVLFLNQSLIVLGTVLFVGTSNLFFRDMENLTQVCMNLLFYATPVIYPVKSLPEQYAVVLNLNPMMQVTELWHELFLKNQVDFGLLSSSFLYNLAICVVGYCWYRKMEKRFAEVV